MSGSTTCEAPTSPDALDDETPTIEMPATARALALSMADSAEQAEPIPTEFPKAEYAINGLSREVLPVDPIVDESDTVATIPAPPLDSGVEATSISRAAIRAAETPLEFSVSSIATTTS